VDRKKSAVRPIFLFQAEDRSVVDTLSSNSSGMAPCAPYPRLWSVSGGSERAIVHRDLFSPIAGTHTQFFSQLTYRRPSWPLSHQHRTPRPRCQHGPRKSPLTWLPLERTTQTYARRCSTRSATCSPPYQITTRPASGRARDPAMHPPLLLR